MTPSGARGWEVFEGGADAYDRWFAAHRDVYEDELALLRRMLPPFGRGLEIGAGTGRSAVPLGISLGLEPSPAMGRMARGRGMEVIGGMAEHLPFCSGSFDLVLMVTAICFFCNVCRAFAEACRVLGPQGTILLAFIDREGELGTTYSAARETSRFLQEARFFSLDEVRAMLDAAGFRVLAVDALANGFVVCRAQKWG